jgi:cysteinyl-tRNA synthetase
MTIRIYNTYACCKQELIPLTPKSVKIYVCGPTVYDEPHLGHARSAVIYDVIRRYLTAKGCSVTYVRNVTDIDDKIIEKANRQNQDCRILSAYFLHRYRRAMERLNVLSPDAEPKATDFILPIQEFISRLMQNGHAYRSGGNVHFAVESFKKYGRLSGRTIQTLSAEHTPPIQTEKKHPADFVLWKAGKPREPSWPSPWGPGRPGWHIECSAMSAGLLGESFDIHGGGADLIFPHHENEIAQSESIFGKTPAKYWMHNGLVNICGVKMSKSLGNGMTLNDLIDIHPPAVLRLLLLSKRYRHPLEFSYDSMHTAAKSYARLYRFFLPLNAPAAAPGEIGKRPGSLWSRFCNAMDDDFNFPQALSVIFEGVRHVNRQMGNTPDARALRDSNGLNLIAAELSFMCREILGIGFEPKQPSADPEKRDEWMALQNREKIK